MKRQKGSAPILILIGIVLVVIIAGGTFYFGKQTTTKPQTQNPVVTSTAQPATQQTSSPTPDETANWKTYTNTKIGFELKYPQRYPQPGLPAGAPNSPSINTTGNEDNTDIIFGQTSTDSVDLIVFPFTGTVDELKNYTKSPITLPLYENTTLIKNVQVGGTMAQWYKAIPKIVYPDAPNIGAIRVYIVGKNHGFILNTTLDHSEVEINQILSTFKFTQ